MTSDKQFWARVKEERKKKGKKPLSQKQKNFLGAKLEQEKWAREEKEEKTKPSPPMHKNKAAQMEADKRKYGKSYWQTETGSTGNKVIGSSSQKKESEKNQKLLKDLNKRQKEFEKSLPAKRKSEAKKLFGVNPKALSIKGGPGPRGKFLKRLSGGGQVPASKDYKGIGHIFTGR
jgi:hypothetical protein